MLVLRMILWTRSKQSSRRSFRQHLLGKYPQSFLSTIRWNRVWLAWSKLYTCLLSGYCICMRLFCNLLWCQRPFTPTRLRGPVASCDNGTSIPAKKMLPASSPPNSSCDSVTSSRIIGKEYCDRAARLSTIFETHWLG